MPSDRVVTFAPWDTQVETTEGQTVLDAAESAGVDIEALCGGKGMCGTCTVAVETGEENLSAPSDQEESVLGTDEIGAGKRLACRAEVHGDVSVFVPNASRSEGGIVMTEGKAFEFELDPAVRQYHLEVEAPTLLDHQADRERVFDAIAETYDREVSAVDRLTLADLPADLREVEHEEEYSTTAAVYENDELFRLEPGAAGDYYGLAVDIGTTTLAIYLMNLRSGETVAVTSGLNPQSTHGGDIISRVHHATTEEGGREELQSEIIQAINASIAEVTKEAGIDASDILEAVFVGNTAMHHLFLGIDAKQVASSPYVPAIHGDVSFKARELGLDIHQSGYLYWLPIIGGWVGPDFVADLLAAGIFDRTETTVIIDIGTNGEIAAYNGETAWVASAPAGPALEGAEITSGMRARPGAIETIAIDPDTGEPGIGVIGDEEPIGICGSGILDAVAQLFLAGIINERGRLVEPEANERVREDEEGHREYILVHAANAGTDSDITISQEDIRDIQNAKAAIQTGTRILLEEAGIEDVDTLVLAGGFGNHIDPESAKLLGMFPDVAVEDVEFIGNAAGYGAMYALLNAGAREAARRIVDEVEYVELAASDVFHDEFMKAMYLPHLDVGQYPDVEQALEKARQRN